jgi:hypothetical protein
MPARNNSLREAAGAIGLTPAGLKQFLMVTLASPSTAEQLDHWYVRYAEPQDNPVEFEDPKAALTYLVELVPPASRKQLGRRLLETVAQGFDAGGRAYPDWLVELQGLYEIDQKAVVAGEHRSAMGKYAHLGWSSDDYARRKQDEIDLEDGRAA